MDTDYFQVVFVYLKDPVAAVHATARLSIEKFRLALRSQRLGPTAEALQALTQALADPNRDSRLRAAEELRDLGPAAAPVVSALAAALADSDSGVCARAAHALSCVGPEAKDAIPSLLVALTHSSISVRLFAALAILNIDPEEVRLAMAKFDLPSA